MPFEPLIFCITDNIVCSLMVWDAVSEPVGNGAGNPKVFPAWTAAVSWDRY